VFLRSSRAIEKLGLPGAVGVTRSGTPTLMKDNSDTPDSSKPKKKQAKKKRDQMSEEQPECDDHDALVSAKKAKDNEVIEGEVAKLKEDAVNVKKKKNAKKNKSSKTLEGEREQVANPGTDAVQEKTKMKEMIQEMEKEDETVDVCANVVTERRKKKDKKKIVRETEEDKPDVEDGGRPDGKRKRRRCHSETGLEAIDGVTKTGEDVLSNNAAESCATTGQSLTVFVGGIPFWNDEEALQADFAECGKVVDVQLVKDDWGRSRGFGYITYVEEAAVLNVLKWNGEDYGGRTLKVQRTGKAERTHAVDHTDHLEVFVTGIPAETTEGTLREKFAACGDIKRLNLPTRSTGKCKGFAWISFEAEKSMKKALKLNGEACGRSKLTVEAAGQHRRADFEKTGDGKQHGKSKGKGRLSSSGGYEVFVSNLPYETTETDLRRDFGECGEITRMHMPAKAGRCMGFAWITYKTTDGLDEALTYHLTDYGARRLRVEKAGQHLTDKGKGKGKGKT